MIDFLATMIGYLGGLLTGYLIFREEIKHHKRIAAIWEKCAKDLLADFKKALEFEKRVTKLMLEEANPPGSN